ncbi:hypothetical protein KRR39_14895 [Nocardioides panacis]|uniref:PH domain-containing protein n=1 Tax=Nocardioides panacis TaxID=2849501 RepID=A0A975XZ21_9ACTN|nr:hypothetical protein [Nocardioides panacis]QWZ06814.1 hypothetical protein KRR39_14895 [Nocardioides panacis]
MAPSAQTPADEPGAERVLERFKPTTGMFVGWAGVVLAVLAVGYVVIGVHTLVGLRIALAAAFAGVLVWVSQLRPRVTAYTARLKLQGSVRDTLLPYVLIDEVTMGQTLNVWVGERRYVCIGIGRSLVSDMRQRGKAARQGSLAGKSRSREFSDKAEMAAPDQTAMSYHTFVVTRIEELVDQAKRELARRGGSTEGLHVRQPCAVPEIVALAVTALAFVVSLWV